jgi:hypothetical protein
MSMTAASDMRSLNEPINYDLSWDPTGTSKSEFELRNGRNELMGKIWKVGSQGKSVIGRSSEGKWTFQRQGFLGREIIIQVEGQEKPIGAFHYKGLFGKGELKLQNGLVYHWDRASVAGEEWVWHDDNKLTLVTFRQLRKIWTENCAVSIPREATVHSALSLLTLFGWFLILILARNEHATAREDGRMFYEDKF